MATSSFGLQAILVRLFFALILVFATYNPFETSFFHWIKDNWSEPTPYMALAGIVLVIGWTIFLRATLRSLGIIGLGLAAAFFGILLWLVMDLGWVSRDNTKVFGTVIEVLFACVLATGMSWSHIRRRMSGQLDTDDLET